MYLMLMSLASSTNVFPIKLITSNEKSDLDLRKADQVCEIVAETSAGEILSMFILGKLRNPRFFKNIKPLPCQYVTQRVRRFVKSSKTGSINAVWMKEKLLLLLSTA